MRRLPVSGHGPEDVLVDANGHVYTGLADGRILRLDADSGEERLIAHTGGRPLGLEWLPDGRLLVCDANLGLLAVNPETGEISTLVAAIDGIPLRFCNNAAVARDGTIYFSDSSTRYGIARWRRDIIENLPTGRLLCRHPDGRVEVLLDGLYFANGVALSDDESWVVVAESGSRRMTRVWLTGRQKGESEPFCPPLHGVPDNLSTGSDGLIWAAVAAPENAILKVLHAAPELVRRAVARLPLMLQPDPERVLWVQAFNAEGRMVHNFCWPGNQYHLVTGVREHNGRLFMGSLEEDAVLLVEAFR